jgi:hypothetical protein
MADQSSSSLEPRSFDKELVEDINDFHLPKSSWTQARNAINNSKTGDLGKLGNEPGNQFCTSAPYTIIGAIHLQADTWAIYSTNEIDSEIGIFKQDTCTYELLINDKCLNFSSKNLIIGTSKPTGDCTVDVYWDDESRNNSRTITVNTNAPHDKYIPWKCTDVLPGTCIDCQPDIDPLTGYKILNCDAIRLAPLVKAPCFNIKKGVNGGTMLNGSYFVVAAYTVNQLKVTDYFTPSNTQSLFSHENVSGSLDITAEFTDSRFSEYELVLISTINQQTVARRLGIYSTQQSIITLDAVNNTWTIVPIENISLLNPVIDRTDSMYSVQDYLVRVGPTNKFDFNYQPIANQIVTKWQSIEYPSSYYIKSGNNTGYMRDEVYSLFIRWVYDTGDKSASYHIPGRPLYTTDLVPPGPDYITGETYLWESTNTATFAIISPSVILPDGGAIIAEGFMGYWESTELYPDNNTEVWDANVGYTPYSVGGTLYQPGGLSLNLCGTPIRHHKMPDNAITPNAYHFTNGGENIRILGLSFENIKPPVMNPHDPIADQVLVQGIVGYEILRGSRQGNRSVIAKGIINNMGLYDTNLDGDNDITTNRLGVYQNYPYNDVQPNPFLSSTQSATKSCLTTINFPTPAEVADAVLPPWTAPTPLSPSWYTVPVSHNDHYLFSSSWYDDGGQILNQNPIFSFHSPDTNFTHPFLSMKELKAYGKYQGSPLGKYEFSNLHPRAKLVTNTAFFVSATAGLGIAYLEMMGDTKTSITLPHTPGYSQDIMPGWAVTAGTGFTLPGTLATSSGQQPKLLDLAKIIAYNTAEGTATTAYNLAIRDGIDILASTVGLRLAEAAYLKALDTAAGIAGNAYIQERKDIIRSTGKFDSLPTALKIATGIPMYLHYVTEGTEATLNLIKNMMRYRDYGIKYDSHCFYDNFSPLDGTSKRREIKESAYIGSNIHTFGSNYRINNQYRNDFVALELTGGAFYPIVNTDNSRYQTKIGTPGTIAWNANVTTTPIGIPVMEFPTASNFYTNSTCTYAGLKQRLRNQYGQLNSIMQLPATTCVQYVNQLVPNQPVPKLSGVFGGDIYIGRYTEKTTFFYFYEWLFGQPDGYEFDYLKHRMLLFPTYWLNSYKFETSDFTSSVISNIFTPSTWVTPSDYYALDGGLCGLTFSVKYAWFYLFSSGVRDFFVESEINIDLRDYGTTDSEKHYPILEVNDLFNTSIIRSTNYYKYDQSLSISKTYLNYTSWGSMQETNYDPYLAETCYKYRPKRLIYSLPAQYESAKDFWKVFLPLNYKDFTSQVTCIKPINKSGAFILFDNASPIQFQGSDTLQTGLGTKLVIGDGALFAQPMQSMANTDDSYEYGSCQNRLSVINTPAGAYFISQNQGKIFQIASQGLKEVSTTDLKWWFAQYLPYRLTQNFPDFDLTDNPVAGIGCQAIYDNENSLIYFLKKDYVLRKDIADTVTYNVSNQTFYVNGLAPITLGDPLYFNDASWTVSLDPKIGEGGGFIAYHDWHPDLLLPGKNTFLSVSKTGTYLDNFGNTVNAPNGIWIHNERCDLYCNYYGIDYPFEVEYAINTVQTINTLRSVEYIMEMYKYAPNCYDRYHILNENFDEAVIYNTEQCSGLLKLDLTPRNNLPLLLQYPQVNLTNIQILYSKVENRYRFNQFWDITRERGGQDVGIPGVPAFAQQTIWDTPENGYARVLNANNMNYDKADVERKKMRHYTNSVLLRKLVSGDRKMLVMIATNKNLYSPR